MLAVQYADWGQGDQELGDSQGIGWQGLHDTVSLRAGTEEVTVTGTHKWCSDVCVDRFGLAMDVCAGVCCFLSLPAFSPCVCVLAAVCSCKRLRHPLVFVLSPANPVT